ncbi:serine O-acetyltransferase [Blochmannia endosymbiont of Camponotus sp.]|uniref:serine O-acetyltransferase n=1 Tax=Blochmannia endosymbiont of Camponotus sp. TaxID=700220 RepID=UPI0020243749|nr:serine O-acetyltransferase [Blochmannia endosymbiont of Camponotus sp.]URJ31283.1 serine O-acetyltransferase [Blochmannia endosymbiont of Camponotus sp.]
MPLNILEIVWNNIKVEAKLLTESEPILANFIYTTILKHKNFKNALIHILSKKLNNVDIPITDIIKILEDIYNSDENIITAAARDIYAIHLNDPSVTKYFTPFLYFKGFHALQAHRISHWLWHNNRQELSMYFYNHISAAFNVDIHPAASIGCGVMIDHATGVVIGETSIIENNVSIMQSVTLGGTGKINGDRHPKVRQRVMIGASAIILGNIEIGYGAKVGAGSVVLHSVPPYATVTGKPARLVRKLKNHNNLLHKNENT